MPGLFVFHPVVLAAQEGYTPLHCAIEAGDTSSTSVLLAAGCDVNARTHVRTVLTDLDDLWKHPFAASDG